MPPNKPPHPPFSSENQPAHNPGRPKGSRNRSTVLAEIFELLIAGKDLTGTEKEMPVEVALMNSLVRKGLEGDTTAIRDALDTVYGKLKDVTKLEMESVTVKREIADTVLKDPSVLAPLPGEPGHPDTKADEQNG